MPNMANAAQLAENLHAFLSSGTQVPIETVCKSALYLLVNVPAARSAALEYVGHFYEVASVLNLNYLKSVRNDPNAPADVNNINHINQITDNISNEILLLLDRAQNKDVWALDLVQWLITVLITVVGKYSSLIGSIAGTSAEDAANPPMVDCLQIWTIQCKPTQSILQLVQKCYISSSPVVQASIFDMLLSMSLKSNLFDWVLCELGALNPKFILKKCFELGVKECQLLGLDTQLVTQFVLSQAPLPRLNAINFFSLNYSATTKSILKELLSDTNDQRLERAFLIYLLKLASQSVALLNLLLNEILGEDLVFINYLWPYLANSDQFITILAYNCIKQLNNSIAVYDLITSILKWLHDPKRTKNEQEWATIQNLLITYVDDLIESVYLSCSERIDKVPKKQTSDSISLLKNLNSIGSSSFKLLLAQIISYIELADERKEASPFFKTNRQLLANLVILIGINGNNYSANAIMAELLKMKPDLNPDGSLSDSSLLIRFRQEINPFYSNCFRETIYSLIKSFANGHSDMGDENLKLFIENLITVYGWDVANPNFMTHPGFFFRENVSNILIEKTCFSYLIDQIKIHPSANKNYSFLILQLYNQILTSNEPDLPNLKLSIEDTLKCGVKLISHFYDLCFTMNESNKSDYFMELNELIDLVKNTCKHLSHYFNDKSPYRNILLRTLIDRLFEFLKDPKLHIAISSYLEESNGDGIDENSNLFTSNLNLINNEIALTKSKLKAVRNVLNEPPAKRLALRKAQVRDNNKLVLNFALLNMLDTICTKSKEENETAGGVKNEKIEIDEMDTTEPSSSELVRSDLLSEQMFNISELLLQHILLDQYYADYNWSSSPFGDGEEHNESEVEAMKVFIERDVAVQNMVENVHNRHIIWQILDFLSQDEQAFLACSPIIRSLLASQIIQWESSQEQPSRNLPKTYEITLKLLNLLNRPMGLLPAPLCHIVDIIPFVSTYEVHLMLLMIWRYLKQAFKPGSKVANTPVDCKQLRYIFQKNIGKLAPFYAKFFKKKTPQAKTLIPTIPTASA